MDTYKEYGRRFWPLVKPMVINYDDGHAVWTHAGDAVHPGLSRIVMVSGRNRGRVVHLMHGRVLGLYPLDGPR